jgi:hypothetical protein
MTPAQYGYLRERAYEGMPSARQVKAEAQTICHCTDCQMMTGSAIRANITAPAEHFVLKSGTRRVM